jgi:phenylacetate-coenzyme A ligase PaaK-like adenylate-forming protein
MARLLRDMRRAGRAPAPEAECRRRLLRFVAYVRDRSPFYRRLYAAIPAEIDGIEALPRVSKAELAARFDEWVTDPAVSRASADAFVSDPSRIGELYLGRYVAFSTSGTTGAPAIILQDAGAMTVYRALLLARRLPGLAAGVRLAAFARNRGRTATVIATGGHFASSVIDALVRSRYPRLYARNRTFSLMEPIPELVRALNEYRPAVLGSYATALAVLAEEQAAGRLRIAPALVLSGAERLSRPLAERIQASFRCPVRDTYAASEFMGIAFDCPFGRLHVNADWVLLEPVDAEGRPVRAGRPSHTTLLTNLANHVQPLIRYDLGDSISVLPGDCPCGCPLPCVLPEGRRDEILRVELPDGTLRPLLPLVLATVIEEIGGVLRYQMVQTGPRRLSLRVDEARGRDREQVCAELLRRIGEYLSAQGLDCVSIEAAPERPRPGSAGGKLRQFVVDPDSP